MYFFFGAVSGDVHLQFTFLMVGHATLVTHIWTDVEMDLLHMLLQSPEMQV